MRASSKAAQDQVVAVLEESLKDLHKQDGHTIAKELFAIADALSDTPRMAAALTDPGRDTDARGALADTLFVDASDTTQKVMRAAASARWSQPEDLATGVEVFGVTALIVSFAHPHEVDTLETELFEVEELLRATPQIRDVLDERTTSTPLQRADLISTLLADSVSADTLIMARRAVRTATGQSVPARIREYREKIGMIANAAIATARTATPLSEAQRERLRTSLERIYHKRIMLNISEDPQLVGGMRVSVGADVYDGTLRQALTKAERALTRHA